MMVLAAGHYKQTQWSAIIEAMINVIVSVVLVKRFGLAGVAVGTLVAMLYRTSYLAWYLSKDILCRKLIFYIKHLAVDAGCVVVALLLSRNISLAAINYLAWIVMAVKVAGLTIVSVLVLNAVFYPSYIKEVIQIIARYSARIGKEIVNMINRFRNKFGGV
jgi:peptidoglycan biosynthesis protein MviN/MurJ (putative lipid II flippase)